MLCAADAERIGPCHAVSLGCLSIENSALQDYEIIGRSTGAEQYAPEALSVPPRSELSVPLGARRACQLFNRRQVTDA